MAYSLYKGLNSAKKIVLIETRKKWLKMTYSLYKGLISTKKVEFYIIRQDGAAQEHSKLQVQGQPNME